MSLRDQAEANRHFYLVFIGNFTDGFFGSISVLFIKKLYIEEKNPNDLPPQKKNEPHVMLEW